MESLFNTFQNSEIAMAIQESSWMFPTLESIHVLAIVTVLGTIAAVDLRLIGWAWRDRSVTAVSEEILPITWIAFSIALLSGTFLFVSRAHDYAALFPFRMKIAAMALAGLNMAVFQFSALRQVADWNHDANALPRSAKAAGTVSLLLWITVLAFGRWIGFEI
jgi:hypothetical protein